MSVTATGRVQRPGALWAMPALAFFGLFALLPMGLVAFLSLTSWNGLGLPHFIGGGNWVRLLHDPQTWESLRLSAAFTALTWLIQTPLSLLLGVWAAGRQRYRAMLSSIFFLPLLLSSAAIAVLWKAILDPNFGLAGWLGPILGFPSGNLIGTPKGALLCVVMVASWQFIPFHTLLYQAGARQIPRVLYDAAIVDGATRAAQFRRITLPQLRNTMVTSSVIMIVGSLTSFETVLILTRGGPGTSTRILPYQMYATGFQSFEMGYGSAFAFILVVLATALSLLMVRLSGFARMRSTLEGL